jgi:hypothetical protein
MGAVTVTFADAEIVPPVIVAVTMNCPVVVPAVKVPSDVTVPPVADQVIFWFAVPATFAVNRCVVPEASDTVVGEIATDGVCTGSSAAIARTDVAGPGACACAAPGTPVTNAMATAAMMAFTYPVR